MSEGAKTWQAVQAEVLRRIRSGLWKPGEPIPHEANLAEELGCARTTVNRALREVAESGLIERRRRAGSRVALRPVRKATLEIPVIRDEVEASGQAYRFDILARDEALPPKAIAAKMAVAEEQRLLHITGLHMAGDRPYAYEDRWIDLRAVPSAATVDFTRISPNEWLVLSIPFEGGDIAFSAASAGGLAAALNCPKDAALFVVERVTWRGAERLTTVRLTFAPGYSLQTIL
ncbi:GntR family transcriptional regulator [Thioclava sp. FR2]|uniref:GntR family transcriptional regulator n=1 Tax=Thioclava sp. FR2 TaxID=3445780 RepID=UPI003EB7782C